MAKFEGEGLQGARSEIEVGVGGGSGVAIPAVVGMEMEIAEEVTGLGGIGSTTGTEKIGEQRDACGKGKIGNVFEGEIVVDDPTSLRPGFAGGLRKIGLREHVVGPVTRPETEHAGTIVRRTGRWREDRSGGGLEKSKSKVEGGERNVETVEAGPGRIELMLEDGLNGLRQTEGTGEGSVEREGSRLTKSGGDAENVGREESGGSVKNIKGVGHFGAEDLQSDSIVEGTREMKDGAFGGAGIPGIGIEMNFVVEPNVVDTGGGDKHDGTCRKGKERSLFCKVYTHTKEVYRTRMRLFPPSGG